MVLDEGSRPSKEGHLQSILREIPPWTGGLLMVLMATALWGSEGLPLRIAIREGLTPDMIALMRTGVATTLLVAVALFRDPGVIFPRRGDAGLLAFNGFMGVAVCATAASVAMSRIPIGLTFLLINTAPLWVMAFSRILRGEPITRQRLFAAAMGLCGVWVALGIGAVGAKVLDPLGVGAALLTGFAYAVYVFNGSSHATWRVDRFRLYVQTFIWGFVVLALIVLPVRGFAPLAEASAKAWISVAYLGIFPTVGAFGLLMMALKRISGTAAAIVSMAEIPFSMFWSWVFLGERVGLSAVLGGILIVVSVILISKESAPQALAESLFSEKNGLV